jgi:hypothetical protein
MIQFADFGFTYRYQGKNGEYSTIRTILGRIEAFEGRAWCQSKRGFIP